MKVSCPSCQTNYKIDDQRIPPGGAKLKCAKCQTTFPIKVGGAAPAVAPISAVPLPGKGAAKSGAVPLPGITAAAPLPTGGSWEEESTRVADMPVPSAAFAPGASPEQFDDPFSPPSAADTSVGVSIPGFDEAPAVPLPGAGRKPARASSAIPLPGISAARPAPAGHDQEESTRMEPAPGPEEGTDFDAFPAPPGGDEAIPLPGADPSADGFEFADADLLEAPPAAAPSKAVPLPGGSRVPGASPHAVPLPGVMKAPSRAAATRGSSAIPLPGGPARPAAAKPNPPAPDFDFADLPSPAQASAPGGFELVDAPPPPPQQTKAAPPSFDFDDLPSPAGQPQAAPAPSFELDSADLPSPAGTPASGSDELGDLPSPAADAFAVDFSSPPPPSAPPPSVSPSSDFGDVDFGSPPPGAGGGDALEFDPTAPAPSQKDELEADLTAPVPAPANPSNADGLEMLDFIDDAAKDAKAGPAKPKAKRFHIRRRSGKVFGPFDEGVVIKMLEDGQLLGNEDASTDGDTWSAIGTVASFGAVIQRLMESPSRAMTTQTMMPGGSVQSAESARTMDRLKDLYEGRMASVAVVDSGAAEAIWRKRLPFIGIAAALVIILGVGGALATTKYGFFGIKALLPAKVSPGTKEFADVQKAHKALLEDTFKNYQEARDAAASALKVKEYPEARALWCQAVYYLHRRYAAASPAELATANAALDGVGLLGKRNLDLIKAKVGAALANRDADKAIALVDDAFARSDNQNDLELSFLRAEAYALKGQTKLAADSLKKVLEKNKDSAKALHALGNLAQAGKQADEAARLYEEALKADPDHVISAVELAAIELLIRRDPEKGAAAVERALAEDRKVLLGPAELARALALKGDALTMQFKLKEATAEFEQALKVDPASLYARAGLGRVLLAQRRYAEAVPLFKETTDRDKQNLDFCDGYLTSLIATGKMDDAFKELESANARFPGNGRIAYLTGRVNDALDAAKEAESNYIRAANADPKLFEANLHLGRMYLRFRRLNDARPQLEAALAKAPDHAAVHAGLGELAVVEGDLEKAKAEFDLATSKDPNLADAHLGLSRVALAREELEVAQSEADRALELDAHLKEARLQRGQVLWKTGKLDEAVAELEKAKTEDPRSPKILVTLGAVKLDTEDLAGAETNLLAALNQEPSNAEAHFYLARIKSRRLEHTGAIDSMKTALEHAPKRADYHYEMGVIFRDAKRSQESVDEWKTTIELDPDHADALEALGLAFLERGAFDQAIGHFDNALKADPQRVRVLAMIGDCYFQATRWNEAISRYLKAIESDPDLKHVYYKLARAYTEKGKHSEAIAWYRKATVADPEAAEAFRYLAYAFKEKGQRADAVSAFKAYLKKRPEAEDKKEIEDEIYDLQH